VAIARLIIGLLNWVIKLTPGQTEAAPARYVMTFNIGVSAGTLSGGLSLAYG